MNTEKIEHVVTERVLSISPGIASAEVILTSPIDLPSQAQGEAYFGLVVIGAGEVVPSGSVKTSDTPSFIGSIHRETLIVAYFAIVLKEEIHVYLENQNIINFLRSRK